MYINITRYVFFTLEMHTPNMQYAFSVRSRYLDDVSLHHLINALCSLSLEAMEMAHGNNKAKSLLYFMTILMYLISKASSIFYNFYFLLLVSGAISVCCGQTAGDWPCQHGSYRDPVETHNWSLTGGNIYLEPHPTNCR